MGGRGMKAGRGAWSFLFTAMWMTAPGVGAIGVAAAQSAADRTSAPAKALTVDVDPRIELIGVVQLLTDGYPVKTQLDFAYRQRAEERFRPYEGHPVFQTFAELSKRGFSFDAPIALMLHLTPPPELALAYTPKPELVARAGGEESMNRFLDELRDFAVTSDFNAFFRENSDRYDEMATPARGFLAQNPLVDQLETYYGMSQAGYHMVLSPLTLGGFGPSVEVAPGRFQIYSVASPSKVEDRALVFFSENGIRDLVWHEFAHSFVNPLTEAHWDELRASEDLLPPISDGLPKWYRQWKAALDEHIVRAVTVRLAELHLGREAGDQAMQQQVEWGFVYVPPLVDALRRFDEHRADYADFAAFFPELVSAVGALQPPEPGSR